MATDPSTTRSGGNARAGEMPQGSVDAGLFPAGRWIIDSDRSTVGFRVKKMGMYHVKGRFRRIEGSIEMREAGPGAAGVRIEAGSIFTRIPPRDAHLRSSQFLDVKRHPDIRFDVETVESAADGSQRVRGAMEIRGVSVPVELHAHTHGAAGDGGPVRVHLQGTVDRHDFGIRPPQPFEMIVGSDVHLDVELLLERAA